VWILQRKVQTLFKDCFLRVGKSIFLKIEDNFCGIRSKGRRDFVRFVVSQKTAFSSRDFILMIAEPGELTNVDRFLLTENVPEGFFHSIEDTILVRVIHP
jgi:hypothetical protein